MNKRGSVSMLIAVGAVPTMLLAGVFAIDTTRVWIAEARLQSALDAAALIVARSKDPSTRDRILKAVLSANHNGGAPSQAGDGPSDWQGVSVTEPAPGQVQVQASVEVKPLLNTITGINLPPWGPKTITRSATAQRTSTGLELALVFDVTLSMTATDAGNGKTRIAAVRDAGLQLLESLYGDKPIPAGEPNTNKKWAENLFISVVPFNVSVNMGSENTHFLGAARASQVYSRSWTGSTPTWGGCVEMRSLSDRDASPQTAGLTRFFAPSTYDPTKRYDPTLKTKEEQPHCLAEAAYRDKRDNNPSGAHNVCMGHNDWTAPSYVLTEKQNTLLRSMVNWSSHVAARVDPWAVAHGPNMMCPPDTHKVLPLTRDRATIESHIRTLGTLTAMPFSAGTNIAPGLQAGWFTLSPNWRKSGGFNGWPSAEPPPVASDPRPPLPALPFDYFLQERRKALILLTDGDNTWLNARMFQGNGASLVRPESRREEGFYGAYGNLRDQLGATTLDRGVSRMNEEAVKWCEAIRTRQARAKPTDPEGPEQITVYTISFSGGVSAAAREVLSNCASKRGDGTSLYWHAPDGETLKNVFNAIGSELSSLRLTQ